MTKITVNRYDDDTNSPVEAQGWFTLEDAEAMPEADPMTAALVNKNMATGDAPIKVKPDTAQILKPPAMVDPGIYPGQSHTAEWAIRSI
jgi:hypothetical protein